MLAKEKLEKAKELKECFDYFDGHDSNAKAVATNKAKELLETEVEGCGLEYCYSCEEYKTCEYSFKCGSIFGINLTADIQKLSYCQTCKSQNKEANKILNAICVLGETEEKKC